MFSDPFTCPVMSPPERGWAELAALAQGRWEEAEAPACGSRPLPGFGSEQCACDGVWTCQGATLPPARPSSLSGWWQLLCLQPGSAPVLLAWWHAGTVCVGVAGAAGCLQGWQLVSPLAVGRQAGAMLCVSIRLLGAAGAQLAPQPTVALEGEALTSSMHSVSPLERDPPAPTQRVGQW